MASNGDEPKTFTRSKNLSVTIGDPDEESEDETTEVFHLREHIKKMALDEDAFHPSMFVEDKDVILPSTSSAAMEQPTNQGDAQHAMPLLDLIANDAQPFQPITQENFVDEVYEKKPPKVVNGYFFGGVLGEGSYSKVKEVIETRTLQRRSIKIIKDKRLRKIPNGQKNVEHEIYILERIAHPNIVKLLEVFRIEEKEKLYLVMEFCICSLQQILDTAEQHRLPEFQCHGYFVQLLDGIEYLHSQGCIHKDIKPGNLLLSSDSCLKICDMGVAELLTAPDPLTNDWSTVAQGTPKFQPPEVVSGASKRFRGRPVDIWACGVTLFNMISGEYPFDGENLMKLFENVTHHPVKWPKSVQLSNDLHQLLSNTLEKNPEKRWTVTAIRASNWHNSYFELIIEQLVPFPDFSWHGANPSALNDGAAAAELGADPIRKWELSAADEQQQEPSRSAAEPNCGEPHRRPLFSRICPWRKNRHRRNNRTP
ncbi:Non-specific serine/threonine protein kinase [Aphelenchoides besseyi]|nr:Non-specific serine/threonine protein kinase [Aphelenchoides besseyi]KAI6207875.1 Non-specific serine/threonine protein kinase [Aphelenchoides besseyi]